MAAAPPRIPRRAVRTARARRRASRRRWVAWASVLTVAVVALAGTALLSPLFAVRYVDVGGIDGELLDRSRTFLAEQVVGTNLLLLRDETLAASLRDALPELEAITVSRTWPDGVSVRLSRRTPLGVWCRATEPARPCSYFDRSAAVWGAAVPSSGTLLLTVIDERPEGFLQPELLEDLLVLADGLEAVAVSIRRATVREGPLHVIAFESTDGFEVRFSRVSDLGEQLEVFGSFLADRRAAGTVPTEYMDATVPGKVYYR